MSRNDIILGVFAAVLVIFSLVVALVLPRRDPGFPGRSMRLFVLVSVLLVAAMLGAVEVLGEGHHFEREGAAEESPEAGGGAERPTETGETETEPAPDGGGEGDPDAGAEVFASAGCGTCHVLEEAGSSGAIGPNLDESEASYDEAVEQIANGGGGMPAFSGQLGDEQIADVAAYVVESQG